MTVPPEPEFRVRQTRIAIESSLEATRPRVLGDSSQLTNVVLNICLDARDAMPEGGTMTLSSSEVVIGEHPDHHLPQDLPPGSSVVLSIRDDRIGMDAAPINGSRSRTADLHAGLMHRRDDLRVVARGQRGGELRRLLNEVDAAPVERRRS